jgi:hypothetical protein
MSVQAELRCRCGKVRGFVAHASPVAVNRVICYCDDCQAFTHQLGRADLLDSHGGSDIVQIAPAALTFVQGKERIAGLRLTPKGVFRWYASCCNTPVGNTVSPAIPFVGVVAQAFDCGAQRADNVFGKPIGAILENSRLATRSLARKESVSRSWHDPFARRWAGGCAACTGHIRSSRLIRAHRSTR